MKSIIMTVALLTVFGAVAQASIVGVIDRIEARDLGARFLVVSECDLGLGPDKTWVTVTAETELFNEDGSPASLEDFEVDMIVSVEHGIVLQSFPGQTRAFSVHMGTTEPVATAAPPTYTMLEMTFDSIHDSQLSARCVDGRHYRLVISEGTSVYIFGQHRSVAEQINQGSRLRVFFSCEPIESGPGFQGHLIPSVDIIIAD